MCFSNLPIEFDDEGNPYLADEAEDVDQPSATEVTSESACECSDVTDDVALDEADPEAVYESILETLPSDARERLTDSTGETVRDTARNRPEPGQTD